jgi:hemerythrin
LPDGEEIKWRCWNGRFAGQKDKDTVVNIAVLDRQHQALFDTVNELKEALTSGHGSVVVDDVLKQLFEYALTHFAAEELLMTEHAFPGPETHRAEHQRFARKIEKFREDYREDYKGGKPGVPVEIMLFLQSWLQEHLLKSDKAYSACLNARGVR